MKKIISSTLDYISRIFPDKSIQDSKKEWNELSEENAKYYIVSKKGKEINEDEFKETGRENYEELILQDEILKETLTPFSDKSVLDIGCGVGRLMEFFSKDFKKVEGVDISEKMVEEGSKRLSHLSNVHFSAGDGEHYPFEDETFDLVFSYIVFQHMPSVEVVKENFREVKRVLKSEGIAKIQIRGGVPPRKGTWYYGPTFTKESARALMDDVGLRIVKEGDDSVKRFFLWLKK